MDASSPDKNLRRGPFLGVWSIVRFNYEYFVAAAVIVIAALSLRSLIEPGMVRNFAMAVAFITISTTFLSLLVSWWVYDRSPLYSFSWLDSHLSNVSGPALNIHAGFDETSALLQSRYPQLTLQVMDFYDSARHTERSIRKARMAHPPFPGTMSCNPLTLTLPVRHYAAVFLILAVHEIRDSEEREHFLKTLKASLALGGKLIIIEHARDLPNFLAYTIGFFHFLPLKVLKKNFEAAGFQIFREFKITPFLSVFYLESK